jgi:hypothetical protein
MSCIMLVCESMDACIFICTVAKSSIHRSSHPNCSIEFSPTNSLKDEGKLFIHSNPLEQVHIVYTSVTKLSLGERLILLHLLSATDENVIRIERVIYPVRQITHIAITKNKKDQVIVTMHTSKLNMNTRTNHIRTMTQTL